MPASQFNTSQVSDNYLRGFNGVNDQMTGRFKIDGNSMVDYVEGGSWVPGGGAVPTPSQFAAVEFAAGNWDVTEDIHAAYAQINFEQGALRGNIGARYVNTSSESAGFVCTTGNCAAATDWVWQATHKTYENVLPSINIAIDLKRDLIFRAAATQVIARPNYSDMTNSFWLADSIHTGGGGNPDLEPYESDNFNASLEWYLAPRAILSAEVFYKNISNYILTRTVSEPHFDTSHGVIANYDVSRPFNAGSAQVKGFAIAYQQNLPYGFGLLANYTYSDGEAKNGADLPFNSRHQASFSPFFESGPVSIRGTYTWRSKYFTGIDRGDQMFVRDTANVDVSATYNVTENIGLTISGMGRSAAFAWRAATAQASAAIRATGDALLMERVADLVDLERQLVAVLLGTSGASVPALRPGTILIAEDLLPSQFLALDIANLAGICTAAGGPTSHVAILAASAGVPMLVAAGESVLTIAEGTPLILDADAAAITVDPSPDALSEASERLFATRERRAREAAEAHEPCRMADGTRIEIFANLGSVTDAAAAVAAGAEGCGLLRTEFLFLERETAPDEEEQRETYSRIAATLGDRPLIVRTLDIGGDKPVPYLPMGGEENPALGLRGVRLSLARPDLMRLQLRAILRGVPAGQCRIMLPMVADLGDYRPVRAILDEVRAELGVADPVQLGVMIETPAAAMLAGQIAREADFLSIGTNDLTQYTLAADRGNAAVSQRIDAMHPAVLRLVREVGRGAKVAGRWAGMCGGLASDPLAAPILIGLGITELSATPAAIPGLKAVVRKLDMNACVKLAEKACDAASPAEVRALAREAQA